MIEVSVNYTPIPEPIQYGNEYEAVAGIAADIGNVAIFEWNGGGWGSGDHAAAGRIVSVAVNGGYPAQPRLHVILEGGQGFTPNVDTLSVTIMQEVSK